MPLPQATSMRDRTAEFLAIAERFQRQQAASSAGSSSSAPSTSEVRTTTVQQHSEFTKKAAEIGHSIHKTSLKLQRLAQLAKRTSMFDDPSREVDELTGIIKQDIQGLNASIAELQSLSRSGKGAAGDSKQSQDHSHTVVDNLRTRLKDATQEFKDVLTSRTESLKAHKERRQLFSAKDDPEAVPLLQVPSSAGKSAQALFGGDAAGGGGGFMQQQLTLAAPQDTYHSSRAEALRNVESTIHELGGIFQKLSVMVAEQGELAIRIDENVEDTLANVESAQTQLLKYLNTISSNRWLLLKVFSVLIVFLVIFVVFIA